MLRVTAGGAWCGRQLWRKQRDDSQKLTGYHATYSSWPALANSKFGVGWLFQPASRQPLRRTQMGVRVEVGDGESIGQAVRRFKNLVRRFGPPGAGGKSPKWHKPPLDHYVKPSELKRRAEYRAAGQRRRGNIHRKTPSPYLL